MPRDSESGFTLVEVLVAVAIMAIAFVAIISAMGTAIIVSDQHKRQATAQTVVNSWAESLKAAPYTACPTTQYNPAALNVTIPAGYTAQAVVVGWWNGDSAAPLFPITPACPTPDPNLQQITVRVTSRRGVSESTSVLKRGS